MTFESQPPEKLTKEHPWDKQARLAREYKLLVESGASEEAIYSKADEVNRGAADLLASDEVDIKDAEWLSVGANSYLVDLENHDL